VPLPGRASLPALAGRGRSSRRAFPLPQVERAAQRAIWRLAVRSRQPIRRARSAGGRRSSRTAHGSADYRGTPRDHGTGRGAFGLRANRDRQSATNDESQES
jgi:hypothetical protein